MYYSIYPKLRAIFTYLPDQEDYKELSRTKTLDEFERGVKKLELLERFPLNNRKLEEYLKKVCFRLEEQIRQTLEGKGQAFFAEFMKSYELKDIRNALYNKKGQFYLFQEEEKSLDEIGTVLEDSIWSKAWEYGYDRYKDKKNKFEIEVALDRQYYINLIKAVDNLWWKDRKTVLDLLKNWINKINRNWKYRLQNKYREEDYEMKQYLIPNTETYEKVDSISGLQKKDFDREMETIFYDKFKNEMFTMGAIISFFMLFRRRIEKLTSIYNSKKFNIANNKLSRVMGEL